MLAVVKMPHTKGKKLEVKGEIPAWLLKRLKKEYGKNVSLLDEDDSLVDIFETAWYKTTEKRSSPGESIRIYRENKGLTQVELGKKLGHIPRQNISSMERNQRGISKEMAKKLSTFFGVPIDRFI